MAPLKNMVRRGVATRNFCWREVRSLMRGGDKIEGEFVTLKGTMRGHWAIVASRLKVYRPLLDADTRKRYTNPMF